MAIGSKHGWVGSLLLVMALALVGYGQLWSPGKAPYSPHSDFVAQHLGTKTVLYNELRQGHGMPFWRPDIFSGYPAFSNPQALYTNPLHFLFYFWKPANALGGTLWLHFVAAAVAMYFVGQVLGLGWWPKLFMAVAALFNFKLLMAAYAGWLPHIAGIVLFPLLFVATFHLAKRPGLGGTLAVAAAGALCLHTGMLQYFYYACLFLAAYVAVRAIGWARGRQWVTLGRFAAFLVPGGIVAAGIAAYLLLPLAGEARLVSRQESSYAFFISYHSLTARHLLTLINPEIIGTPLDGSYAGKELWEDVAYFGLIPLVLSALGALLGRRRLETRYLTACFFCSLILTVDTPFLRLLYAAVPGFDLFRCPSRFLFLTAFFGIALAGVGLEEIMTRLRARRRGIWLGPALAGLLILAMTAEGRYYSVRYLTMSPVEDTAPSTEYSGFLARDGDVFRVAPLNPWDLNYGWAAGMGLELISGFDSFTLSHYQTLFELVRTGEMRPRNPGVWMDLNRVTRWDLLDILNVKYLICSEPPEIPQGRFELVARWDNQPSFLVYDGMKQRPIFLYRNREFLPRAFWVDAVVETAGEERAVMEVMQRGLRNLAVVEGSREGVSASEATPGDRIAGLEAKGGYLRFQTVNQARRFVVISEVWHPGWSAVLDGRELPLFRTDHALMGAWIPPGSHEVSLRFRPVYWNLALGITAISSVLWMILLFAELRWRSRGQAPD